MDTVEKTPALRRIDVVRSSCKWAVPHRDCPIHSRPRLKIPSRSVSIVRVPENCYYPAVLLLTDNRFVAALQQGSYKVLKILIVPKGVAYDHP
jgi:hypothetical protein